MRKLAFWSFVAAWLLFALIVASGNLIWSNRLLWGPLVLLLLTAFIAPFVAFDEEEHRMPLLLLAAVAFCCALAYVVFYVFFLFGLNGH